MTDIYANLGKRSLAEEFPVKDVLERLSKPTTKEEFEEIIAKVRSKKDVIAPNIKTMVIIGSVLGFCTDPEVIKHWEEYGAKHIICEMIGFDYVTVNDIIVHTTESNRNFYSSVLQMSLSVLVSALAIPTSKILQTFARGKVGRDE